MSRVLVVEDQAGEREALSRMLRVEGYEVRAARDVDEALSLLAEPIAAVVSDLRMGPRSGLELLKAWKAVRPRTPFILVTAYGDVETAVSAMKLGAQDYLTKPVNPDELLRLVAKAVQACPAETAATGDTTVTGDGFETLLGRSQAMRDVIDRAQRAARTDSLVLILGESGTGKELLASAIHRNSPRRDGPYVAVNIAAIPETLVESELFGHVKGAFTGAAYDRAGRFTAADGGTLFIDEIGDFELSAQAKLLRVLESHRFTPVGGDVECQADVRVVAATSRNLDEKVAAGEFREDLYYRLNVVTVRIPPLRERREDIPLLIEVFLDEFCAARRQPRLPLAPALVEYLLRHPWPGNVRQLRNAVESMVVLARHDTLTLTDLPEHLRTAGGTAADLPPVPRDASLEQLEKAAIAEALRRNDNNRTHAAAALGISVRTLQRKLKSWGLAPGDETGPVPGH